MKKIILFFLIGLSALQTVQAKGYGSSSSESSDYIQFGAGVNYLFGDLGGANYNNSGYADYDFPYTRPSLDLAYIHDFSDDIGVRVSFMYNLFGGNDKHSRNSFREYLYTTNSFELSLQLIYYFLHTSIGRTSLDVYAFAGGAYNWYKTEWGCFVQGSEYALRNRNGTGAISSEHPDVDVDGEYSESDNRWKRSDGCFALPVGLGVRMPITQTLNIGAEAGYRFAFGRSADYIDGMETWYSNSNDMYFIFNLTVAYCFRGTQNYYSNRRKSHYGKFRRR